MSTHVYPSLRYRDARAAIGFLEIMLGQESEDGIERWGAHAGRGWNYVTVEDADAHFAQAKAAGAEITMELTDLDYGSRDYGAKDPEGNVWSFGTYDPLND